MQLDGDNSIIEKRLFFQTPKLNPFFAFFLPIEQCYNLFTLAKTFSSMYTVTSNWKCLSSKYCIVDDFGPDFPKIRLPRYKKHISLLVKSSITKPPCNLQVHNIHSRNCMTGLTIWSKLNDISNQGKVNDSIASFAKMEMIRSLWLVSWPCSLTVLNNPIHHELWERNCLCVRVGPGEIKVGYCHIHRVSSYHYASKIETIYNNKLVPVVLLQVFLSQRICWRSKWTDAHSPKCLH